MDKKNNIWECECGSIEYGEYPPEECAKCWKVNSFLEASEDVIEKTEENILGKLGEEVE